MAKEKNKNKENLLGLYFMGKTEIVIGGAGALLIGLYILSSNPLRLANFPNEITSGALAGLILFFVGLGGLYNGLKS